MYWDEPKISYIIRKADDYVYLWQERFSRISIPSKDVQREIVSLCLYIATMSGILPDRRRRLNMRHQGRMLSLLIVIFSTAALLLYNYFVYSRIDLVYIAAALCYGLMGWQMGKHYDKVKYNTLHDSLTKTYNRRFVAQIFPKLLSLSERKGEKLILFIIDVDNFKQINDLHHHETGDLVLRRISQILTESFRQSDYVIRWGGDEFVVILPCAKESGMAQLLAYLQNRMKQLSAELSIDVSVSIGYAVYPDQGEQLDELLLVADKMMYQEKNRKHAT